MKIYLTLLMFLCLSLEAKARVYPSWYDDYDSLNDKATLVVIATPTTVGTNTEKTSFGNIFTQGDPKPEEITGTGVETGFRIITVLKGERNMKALVLRHYVLVKSESMGMKVTLGTLAGPSLISFDPNSKKMYLMFLRKEADGRYVAVTGQEDPAYSVKQLDDLPLFSSGASPSPNAKQY
jgi:hypothetical protein